MDGVPLQISGDFAPKLSELQRIPRYPEILVKVGEVESQRCQNISQTENNPIN